MPEGASQRPDAAQPSDDVAVICHTHDVRAACKSVNLESVRVLCDTFDVDETETIGARLKAILDRSGLSLRALAAAAGYNHASGIQRYVTAHHNIPLKVDVAMRLADAMEGKGSPPIRRNEVMDLVGMPPLPATNASPFQMEGASMERLREDLPVFGTALGALRIVDGEAIEQTTLNQGEIVTYAKRPTILNGNSNAYGLYVQGSSMVPVHPDGSLLLVEKMKPLRVGDDVVVYLRPETSEGDNRDDGERARSVLVKRLVRRTAQYVELEQFSPAMTFRIEAAEILRVDRVLTLGDLLS